MTIRVKDNSNDRVATYKVFVDGSHLSVTAIQRHSQLNERAWKRPRISWPSVGEVYTDTARDFAAAILKACELADELDKRTGQSAGRAAAGEGVGE